MWKWLLLGIVLGMATFMFLEGGKKSNSFLDSCWKRQQPKWIVHNKVYVLGAFVVWRGFVNSDMFIIMIGSAWIGLHVAQDLAERYHEYKQS